MTVKTDSQAFAATTILVAKSDLSKKTRCSNDRGKLSHKKDQKQVNKNEPRVDWNLKWTGVWKWKVDERRIVVAIIEYAVMNCREEASLRSLRSLRSHQSQHFGSSLSRHWARPDLES